jgi:2,4-dienoyl-CoA reductase (NADPH2)
MATHPHLFSPIRLGSLELANRITMAPLYLGYAQPTGEPSPRLYDHYEEMGASGAAMVMVENAAVEVRGLGAPHMLRVDDDARITGLAELARRIQKGGAKAGLQLNHAGRFAFDELPLAPSAVPAGEKTPRALEAEEIAEIVHAFAAAARRAKDAGFDLVELHGGTGYLLAQFLSPHTNRRDDAYGGDEERRLRLPLEVIAAARKAVGPDFTLGMRYMADEWLPAGGLTLEMGRRAAPRLAAAGLDYLSVMGGTYESFFLPERLAQDRQQGFMVDLAEAVKQKVEVPVITAGRIQEPGYAEEVIAQGRADLVGLARVLLADPRWPAKAREGRDREIVPCEAACRLCFKLVGQGKPVICSQWPEDKRRQRELRG